MRGSRQEKSLARAFQTDVTGPKKQMLMLPGWDYRSGEGALCVHAGLSQDLIDRRTRLVCVERAPSYIPAIVEHLEHLGLTSRTRLHAGELRDLVPEPHERFDFAFFDFEHIPDRDTALWIAEVFTGHLRDGADISLTVEREDETSTFLADCALAFAGRYQAEAETARGALDLKDPEVLIHALVLASLFRDYRYRFHPPFAYNPDTRAMLAFKLTDLQRQEPPHTWPSIREVLEAAQEHRTDHALDR